MPGVEGEDPTDDQIAIIRKRVFEHLAENGQECFDPRDVNRLRNEDQYVKRFFLHVFDVSGDQVENAVNMVIKSFKWRKEMGINDVTEEKLNSSLKEKGTLYKRNFDRDGMPLLVFNVKKHVKGAENMDEMKLYFCYLLERIDRETNGGQLTMVFDCEKSGLKNMDMDIIQYIINVFKDYYPWNLNYILVFEMPWVLNAAWKIIKTWLPAAAVKKIKFLTKSNIGEYVDEENRFDSWGGLDDWEYEFEPEVVSNAPLGMETEDGRKKVHFAEIKQSQSADSIASQISHGSPALKANGHDSSQLIILDPSDEIVFNQSPNGELLAKIQIKNISDKSIVYKIKTTSPEKYRVRPSMSLLKTGASNTIEIHVQSAHMGSTVSLVRDKFLVTVVSLQNQEHSMSQSQIGDVMKSSKPDEQHRLRCVLSAENQLITRNSLKEDGAGSFGPLAKGDGPNKQIEVLTKKINALSQSQSELQSDLASMKTLVLVFLIVIVCLLLVVLWMVSSSVGEESVPFNATTVIADNVSKSDL